MALSLAPCIPGVVFPVSIAMSNLFEFPARFIEQRIRFRPAFDRAWFLPVGSIGNQVSRQVQEQVLQLTTRQYDNQRMYQDQIQSLIDAHIKVSRETIMALKSLAVSLKEAKDRGQLRPSS